MREQYAIGYCTAFAYLHSVPAEDSKSSYQQILRYLFRALDTVIRGLSGKYPAISNISRTGSVALM